jgi:hypothetical protein
MLFGKLKVIFKRDNKQRLVNSKEDINNFIKRKTITIIKSRQALLSPDLNKTSSTIKWP